jgi:hypothetical protein
MSRESHSIFSTSVASQPAVFISLDTNGTWIHGNEEHLGGYRILSPSNRCVCSVSISIFVADCFLSPILFFSRGQSAWLSRMVWTGTDLWNTENAAVQSILLFSSSAFKVGICVKTRPNMVKMVESLKWKVMRTIIWCYLDRMILVRLLLWGNVIRN